MALLARRDFSRAELRARLLRGASPAREGCDLAAEVDRVLDQVQALGLLNEPRLVEGFVRARSARFGPVRLRHELARRGVEQQHIDAAAAALDGDEFARGQALWLKRFKVPALDARERARQGRFLAGRGFSHEVIRRILKTAL